MATAAVLPSSSDPAPGSAPNQTPPAPPNFYAQAAMAKPAPAQPDYSEQNRQFKSAVEKLLTIFDKMEKLTPNGLKIDKDIRGMADALKATRDKVFEGQEGAGAEDEDQQQKQAGAGTEATGTAQEGKSSAGAPGGTPASVPAAGAASQ